jgi:hypothetical protein
MNRLHDWLWVASNLFILVGFGAIATVGFMRSMARIAPKDGRCRIGLPRYVTLPLLSFDALVNILLTIIFVLLLGPVISSNNASSGRFSASRFAHGLGGCCGRSQKLSINLHTANPHVAKRIEKLLWRTFVGSCLVVIPTIGNMIQMALLEDREFGWLCLTVCTFDGTQVTVYGSCSS